MNEWLNTHLGWVRGMFIPSARTSRWAESEVREANAREHLLVRPGPKQNAVFITTSPADSAWLAERLNLAALLGETIVEYDKVVLKLAEGHKWRESFNPHWTYYSEDNRKARTEWIASKVKLEMQQDELKQSIHSLCRLLRNQGYEE